MKTKVPGIPRFARVAIVLILALLLGSAGLMQHSPSNALAGAEIVGNPQGAVQRALIGDQSGGVKRIVYFPQAAYTMAGANTPVASDPFCGDTFLLHKAQVVLVGTMAGTNPTLAVLWQNSMDGGVTWTSIGTWTTINATVTPASQSQTVADVYNASTAVAYGDCWRATYTMAGTGTVVANIGITGFEK